jgi:hypothetical protein
MDALQLLRGLAIKTTNIIKGASFINSEGKHIELTDKATVAKSKKEIRDASGIYLREEVSRAASNLNTYLSKDGYIVFPAKLWVEFITVSGRDSKDIISQLIANNRAGMLAEGIFILLGNEVAEANYVKSLDQVSSIDTPSEVEPKTEEHTPKKESTSKPKGSKSKAS